MEETTLITISRNEYNTLLRSAQIVIGLSTRMFNKYDDGINNLIHQSRAVVELLKLKFQNETG